MVKLLEFLDRHTARHLFRSSHLKGPVKAMNSFVTEFLSDNLLSLIGQ